MKVCGMSVVIKAAVKTFWERVKGVNISAVQLLPQACFHVVGSHERRKREGSRWMLFMKCSTFFLFYLS